MRSYSKAIKASSLVLFLGVGACTSSGTLPSDGASDGGPSTEGGPTADGEAIDGKAPSDGGTSSDEGSADGDAEAVPSILASTPLEGATGVPVNASISATFNEPMAPDTLTSSTFTLTTADAGIIAGTVAYATSKAVFWPTSPLASNTSFTATITSGAKSVAGVPLAANESWTFTTGATTAAGVPIDLGTAGGYVILAETGISTIATSAVTGNLGISPAAATYITGFSLVADSTNVFSTSSQVTGKVYAADYAVPTPANLTTAIGDMRTAFTAAAGRAPDILNLGAGAIGGMTLPAGVYGWGTGLLIPTNVTLTGNATDVWVFQVAENLTVSNGVEIQLAGGALPKNVFWQVSGSVSIGTTARFEGVVLCQTGVALKTGASITGGLLAQTAVTIDACTVAIP
jgi:hypothetical protein